MKYSILLIFVLLFTPFFTNAAATYNSKGTCLESTGATSLNCSFTNTAGTYMVVVMQNRLNTGGCGTTDIDSLAVTYNGVALTFQKGSATNGVLGGAGACVFGHVLTLANPSTGVNTLAFSWTGTARIAATVFTFAGAGSIGTIQESITTGNFSLNATITANDILMGGLAVADLASKFACLDSNAIETADAGGNVGSCGNTNTGSGSVNVHGTYATYSRIFWAIPILSTAAAVEDLPPQDIISFY